VYALYDCIFPSLVDSTFYSCHTIFTVSVIQKLSCGIRKNNPFRGHYNNSEAGESGLSLTDNFSKETFTILCSAGSSSTGKSRSIPKKKKHPDNLVTQLQSVVLSKKVRNGRPVASLDRSGLNSISHIRSSRRFA